MSYYTQTELAKLKRLETKLYQATSHSQVAVAIGRQMAEVHRQAHIRNNPPNAAVDRAMSRLSERLGLQ